MKETPPDPEPVSIPAYKPEIDIIMPRLPTLAARAFVYILIITLITGITWANLSHVEVIVECHGSVIPQGESINVEAPLNGLIEEIYVEAGDHVNEGDLLLRIDTLEMSGRIDRSGDDLEALQGELDRIDKSYRSMELVLQQGPRPELIAAITLPEAARAAADLSRAEADLREARLLAGDTANVSEVMSDEARLRREEKEAEISMARRSLEEAMAERDRTMNAMEIATVAYAQSADGFKAATASREGAERILAITSREEKTYHALSDSGMISEIEYLSRLREYERQKYEVERLKAHEREADQEQGRLKLTIVSAGREIKRAEAAVSRAEDNVKRNATVLALLNVEGERKVAMALKNYHTAYALTEQVLVRLAADRQSLAPKLRSQLSVLGESVDMRDRGEVRAPLSGTIALIEIKNRWQYITPGKPVIYIIPDTAVLVAQMRLSNRDVAKIKAGNTCRFKFEAYPFNDFGVLTGKVMLMDPDVIPGSGEYRVLAHFDKPWFETTEGRKPIRAGMELGGEIRVRSKRIIEYLFEPFYKLTKNGMTVTE